MVKVTFKTTTGESVVQAFVRNLTKRLGGSVIETNKVSGTTVLKVTGVDASQIRNGTYQQYFEKVQSV